MLVNSLEYYKVDRTKNERNCPWVSNLEIISENAEQIMRAGCARWKIENATFNEAKNQGYHMEHGDVMESSTSTSSSVD